MDKSEVRNPDNRLVFSIDQLNRVVERLEKGWITRIEFKDDGTVDIQHYRKTA